MSQQTLYRHRPSTGNAVAVDVPVKPAERSFDFGGLEDVALLFGLAHRGKDSAGRVVLAVGHFILLRGIAAPRPFRSANVRLQFLKSMGEQIAQRRQVGLRGGSHGIVREIGFLEHRPAIVPGIAGASLDPGAALPWPRSQVAFA